MHPIAQFRLARAKRKKLEDKKHGGRKAKHGSTSVLEVAA
jgi:hypothetical protein